MRLWIRRKKKQATPAIFDEAFYQGKNKQLLDGLAAYQHYCQFGCQLGLDPNPFFSTRYYQQRYLEADQNANPILHYLANAASDTSINPHPLFDTRCYLQQVQDWDGQQTPLEHFFVNNASNLASPSVFFDTRRYLQFYPEVGPSGFAAAYHYLRFGRDQGRLKSVACQLIESAIDSQTDSNADCFLKDPQPEIRFLANVLRLDSRRPNITIATEAAGGDYSVLIKKLSASFAAEYQTNTIHLFGTTDTSIDEYFALGPVATIDNDPEHPFLEFGNNDLLNIVSSLPGQQTLYLNNRRGPLFDRLMAAEHPVHLLLPDKIDTEFGRVIGDHSLRINSITTSPTSLGQLTEHESIRDSAVATFDFESINCCGPIDMQGQPLDADGFRTSIGLSSKDTIVAGAGELDLCSGFDRFVATMIGLLRNQPQHNLWFVWIGKLSKLHQQNIAPLLQDLTDQGFADRLFICEKPSVGQVGFEAADLVLLTDRANPSSTSVADAINATTPIVWFGGHPEIENYLQAQAGEKVNDVLSATHAIGELLSSSPRQARLREQNQLLAAQINSVDLLTRQLADQFETDFLQSGQLASLDPDSEVRVVPFLRSPKRRVVFATPVWEISGVNTFIENMVRELNRRGFDAWILFTTAQAIDVPQHLLPDVPCKFLTNQPNIRPKVTRQLLKKYLALLAPCVFVPNYDFNVSPVSQELPASVATLGVLHSDDPAHYVHGYRMGPYWDKIVSVSQTIHSKLLRINPAFADRAAVIRYGVVDQGNTIDSHRHPNDRLKIIYTGRIIQEQKRILDFVDVADRLNGRSNQFEFTFVGDGPAMDEFRQRMRPHLKSGLVKILGRVEPGQIPALLRQTHVLALTSEFEGLPLSLLESLSAGLVPVVTDIESGVGEILQHGINALLSPVGAPSAMADNLLALARDPNLFQRLSIASRRTLIDRELTADHMADAYAGLLNDMFDDITRNTASPTTLNPVYCPAIERMLDVA